MPHTTADLVRGGRQSCLRSAIVTALPILFLGGRGQHIAQLRAGAAQGQPTPGSVFCPLRESVFAWGGGSESHAGWHYPSPDEEVEVVEKVEVVVAVEVSLSGLEGSGLWLGAKLGMQVAAAGRINVLIQVVLRTSRSHLIKELSAQEQTRRRATQNSKLPS